MKGRPRNGGPENGTQEEPFSRVTLEQAGIDKTGADPVKFVIDANIRRRHLNESQRAMAAAAIARLQDGQRKDHLSEKTKEQCASIEAPASQADAAEMLNVSRSAVQRARKVVEDGNGLRLGVSGVSRDMLRAARKKLAPDNSSKRGPRGPRS